MSLRVRRAPFFALLIAIGCLAVARPHAQDVAWTERLSAAEVTALVTSGDRRIVDLRVDTRAGRARFDVALTDNADGRAWAWSADLTAARMEAMLKAAPRFPAVMVPYQVTPGETRLAVVWAPGAPSDTALDWVVMVDVSSEALAGIRAGDRPDDAQDAAAAAKALTLERVASYSTAAGERHAVVARRGARVSAPGRAPVLGLAAEPDITSRVSALLATTDGTQGLYLRQIGGAVLAQQNETFVFEPASSIKAAAGLHAFRQVEAGTWALGNLVNVFQPPAAGSSCPGNTDVGDETLTVALQEMLWHSDNSRTRVIVDTFGRANVNATMTAVGMTDSSINHDIGCGGPVPDQMTLVDAGVLYEGSADGTLIAAANVDLFHSFFPGRGQFMAEGYDWTGIWDTDIPNMLAAEAPAGMTASQRQAYRGQMDLAYKAGNYKICTSANCATYLDHYSVAGWASVPFCTGTVMAPREFVFGIFLANSTSDATVQAAFSAAKGELLREQIRDGMASCFHADLSLTSAAAPSPVLSGANFTVTLDAANAGPVHAAAVSVSGATPPGTTFVAATPAPGWTASTPAAGATGALSFADTEMQVGATPQFTVTLGTNCAVPDGSSISFNSTIASATTPDLTPGNNSTSALVQVSNPPPTIGALSASPALLWPANHKMVDVTIAYTTTDNCGIPVCALTAVSSEPDDGVGDGNTTGDIEIVDAHHLRLRAERSGGGPGRSYTVTAACTDSGGGSSTAQTMVVVPHNK
jgi:hypothetical protein